MADKLASREPGPLGPYANAVAPTTSDLGGEDPAGVAQAIMCTGAGNIKVDLVGGSTITLAITAGWDNRALLRIKRVWTTGTTATGLLLLYI